MAMVELLMEQLKARGLSIRRGNGETLLLCGPDKEKTPEIMQTLKKFKADILEFIIPGESPGTKCDKCSATVYHATEAGNLCIHRGCPFREKK